MSLTSRKRQAPSTPLPLTSHKAARTSGILDELPDDLIVCVLSYAIGGFMVVTTVITETLPAEPEHDEDEDVIHECHDRPIAIKRDTYDWYGYSDKLDGLLGLASYDMSSGTSILYIKRSIDAVVPDLPMRSCGLSTLFDIAPLPFKRVSNGHHLYMDASDCNIVDLLAMTSKLIAYLEQPLLNDDVTTLTLLLPSRLEWGNVYRRLMYTTLEAVIKHTSVTHLFIPLEGITDLQRVLIYRLLDLLFEKWNTSNTEGETPVPFPLISVDGRTDYPLAHKCCNTCKLVVPPSELCKCSSNLCTFYQCIECNTKGENMLHPERGIFGHVYRFHITCARGPLDLPINV